MEKDKIEEVKCEDRILYWNDSVVAYYRKLINTIGKPYCKYIILKDFGFKIPIQNAPYKVKAIRIRQHSRDLYLFSMDPDRLMKLAYVSRRDMRDPWAYQRLLNMGQLRDIARFVLIPESGESSLLANDIVLAFEEPGVKFTGRTLRIPAIYSSVYVIDGQHRLYAFAAPSLNRLKLLKEEKRSLMKEYVLVCVGVRDINQRIQAMLFREINEFQRRINRNLLLDLFHHLEIGKESGVWLRIDIVKKLREQRFFENRIKILATDKGNTSLATFVDYPDFAILIKNLGRKSMATLRNYFRTVSEVFEEEWNQNPEKYVLSTNRGIRILITLLNLVIKYDGTSEPNLRKCLLALRKATSADKDYFKIENYKGKALGAAAPAYVALAMWAKDIRKLLPDFPCEDELNPDAYGLLKELEDELRMCIETELAKLAKDWWKQRVPNDVKERAEERKRKNERPWPWLVEKDLPEICYVDFADYRKIIAMKSNWRDSFERIFKERDTMSTWLKELEPIRNAVMHPRKLSKMELETLRLHKDKISQCIKVLAGPVT